jgi:hypothetical protein
VVIFESDRAAADKAIEGLQDGGTVHFSFRRRPCDWRSTSDFVLFLHAGRPIHLHLRTAQRPAAPDRSLAYATARQAMAPAQFRRVVARSQSPQTVYPALVAGYAPRPYPGLHVGQRARTRIRVGWMCRVQPPNDPRCKRAHVRQFVVHIFVEAAYAEYRCSRCPECAPLCRHSGHDVQPFRCFGYSVDWALLSAQRRAHSHDD